jgi:hypothetical protein
VIERYASSVWVSGMPAFSIPAFTNSEAMPSAALFMADDRKIEGARRLGPLRPAAMSWARVVPWSPHVARLDRPRVSSA